MAGIVHAGHQHDERVDTIRRRHASELVRARPRQPPGHRAVDEEFLPPPQQPVARGHRHDLQVHLREALLHGVEEHGVDGPLHRQRLQKTVLDVVARVIVANFRIKEGDHPDPRAFAECEGRRGLLARRRCAPRQQQCHAPDARVLHLKVPPRSGKSSARTAAFDSLARSVASERPCECSCHQRSTWNRFREVPLAAARRPSAARWRRASATSIGLRRRSGRRRAGPRAGATRYASFSTPASRPPSPSARSWSISTTTPSFR